MLLIQLGTVLYIVETVGGICDFKWLAKFFHHKPLSSF